MEGYILLHRKIMKHDHYGCEKFCKMMAWIDLLMLANHTERYLEIRGIGIMLKRGELAYSSQTLARRWSWSREKVRKFLGGLETRQQIRQQKTNVTTLVSIVNYDVYQKTIQQTIQQKSSR